MDYNIWINKQNCSHACNLLSLEHAQLWGYSSHMDNQVEETDSQDMEITCRDNIEKVEMQPELYHRPPKRLKKVYPGMRVEERL